MKNRIRVTGILTAMMIFTLFTSSLLTAQQGQGRRQGPPRQPDAAEIAKIVDDLAETLSLSETQKEKVLELYTDHFNQTEPKQNSSRMSREAMREMHETKRAELQQKIKALLNEDQLTQYSAYLKQQPGPGGKRPERRN